MIIFKYTTRVFQQFRCLVMYAVDFLNNLDVLRTYYLDALRASKLLKLLNLFEHDNDGVISDSQIYLPYQVVYIAPLKALVKERIKDWKIRMEEKLGKRVVELTGKFISFFSVI